MYGIIRSAIIRVANENTMETARIGMNRFLICTPLERRASISFCDERLPITMLAEARELKGMVYIRNCGMEKMTSIITSMTLTFFSSIFCASTRIWFTKKMKKKKRKATMKERIYSFPT